MALQELPKEIGNYYVFDEIGHGGFGTVYLCRDKTTRELFAIKEIKEKSKIDPKTEIDIHTRLMNKRGNRVVKIIDHFKRGGFVYIVMEYCKEGTTDILIQLCEALKLIHEEDIAHRDLTPNNVLIWEIKRGRNGDVKRIRVKVTDFGLSKETPKNKLGLFKTTLGTDPFMAPEVFAGKYTKAADVFSLGSMFYFLLTGSYFDKRSKLSNALDGVIKRNSISKFDSNIKDNLRSFMHAMLCDENSRIRLDEIRTHEFMKWFYDERYEIDPELREFCSHSQNGHLRSRSQSRESERKPLKQINRQDVQKRSNRDSAFGSDRNIFSGDSNNTIRNIQSNPTRPQHASTSKDKRLETDLPATSSQNNEATIYDSKQAPWPLPTVPNTYTAVNGLGRCIFYKYSHVKGNIPLVAVLEMTSSKDNQTICKIFELRQNDREQELRILQPEGKDVRKPERNEERITDARELFRLKSLAEFRGCKMAKEGYETLWGFLKMAASRVVQAYCEEIIGHHKYRVELCLNGWANLYIGPRSAKDINDLKLSGRQKTHNGQVEQVKTGATLNENEKLLVIELAKALRTHVKESVWKKQFDRRNIRCTIYTHGFG
uniref:Protein kinase domain-containing protein n=1 Tax=Meloidogyne javanica TaxID=6303 RepID=A0A915LVX0_MELJA